MGMGIGLALKERWKLAKRGTYGRDDGRAATLLIEPTRTGFLH